MKAGLIRWWRGRTPREQGLLLAGALVAVAAIAWLLVVRPLSDALAEAKARHADAVTALAEVRSDAAAVRAARPAPAPAAAGPIDAVVSAAASDAGFPITRLERQGPRATLVLEAVRPPAFFEWLGRLEAGRGLTVERLSATPNTDQTLTVQVTFRGPQP